MKQPKTLKNIVLCTTAAGVLFASGCGKTYYRDPQFLSGDPLEKKYVTTNPLEDIFLTMLAGLGAKPRQSPTDFDWRTYQRNFSTNTFSVSKDHKPTLYCFGGWDSHDNNQIFRMTDLVAANKVHSDYKIFDFDDWRDSLEKIKQQYAKESPIVLIGHSGGGSNAIKTAKVLEKVNVPVGILLVDSTHLRKKGYFPANVDGISNTFTIPYNVFHVENYVSNGPFQGRKLTRRDFANPKTTFENHHINGNHLDCLKTKYTLSYVRSIYNILNNRKSNF